jgi:Ricin-type beta-trefoil lectin domain
MMRGIRRLVVCAAATGLLTAGVVGASLQVAHAQTVVVVCGGNGSNDYVCNLDTTISDASAISVTADSGAANENLDVNWTVSCTDSAGSGNQEGATDNASTPLTVPLTPLPSSATDGTCQVNVGISLPAHDVTPVIDYTGSLSYTPAGSTSTPPTSGAVHPVKGLDGKCLDDKGNSSANRALAVIWSCSSTDQAQNWSFSNNELIHNGKCLNDQGNAGSGGHVILYSCGGGSNDKWSELANGELKLQAHNGQLCLDDPRSSTKNGTQLIVYTCHDSANQKWSLP